jgi:hypothetical protein
MAIIVVTNGGEMVTVIIHHQLNKKMDSAIGQRGKKNRGNNDKNIVEDICHLVTDLIDRDRIGGNSHNYLGSS